MDKIFCRNCGKELSKHAEICVFCGSKPLTGKTYCFYCGAKDSVNEEGICIKCGVRQLQLKEKPKNIYVWLLALLPLIEIFIGIFINIIFKPNFLTGCITGFIIWVILTSIFGGLDLEHLKKLGYNFRKIWILGIITFTPLYLFIRAYRVDKKYSYAIVWLILYGIFGIFWLISVFSEQ